MDKYYNINDFIFDNLDNTFIITKSDNLRIDLRINASYNNYLKAIEDAKKYYAPANSVSETLRSYKEERKKRKQIIELSNRKRKNSNE